MFGGGAYLQVGVQWAHALQHILDLLWWILDPLDPPKGFVDPTESVTKY
jgi:hypothetical protein